jgi:hypothetical protein
LKIDNVPTGIDKGECTMKNLTLTKKLALGLAVFCAQVTPVWAEGTAREDNSGLFVWIFLAFCALIVIAQLIPALLVLFGFAKGVKKETPHAAAKNG